MKNILKNMPLSVKVSFAFLVFLLSVLTYFVPVFVIGLILVVGFIAAVFRIICWMELL